jgi:predicted phosphodiesterase
MLPEQVAVLGDPHLGRKFKTGVPLHRVGEREEMVWAQFEDTLKGNFSDEIHFHVNMGDLFDKFVVAPEVVLRAAQIYQEATSLIEGVIFVILEGNHDVSKDSARKSSFDLFARLVAHDPMIKVVRKEPWACGGFGFVPYHPFRPTEELVADLPDGLTAVFGHWDIQDWGGTNVIPTKLLAEKQIPLAVSGHDHVARKERRDGVDIIVTGSMQPYTHAEDKIGEWYVTTSLPIEEDMTNKNVRVLLKEGETLPTDLECLSITAKRVTDEDEKVEVDTAEFESLDLGHMLFTVLQDLSIKDELMEAFHNDQ